jgi:hypothetical protein
MSFDCNKCRFRGKAGSNTLHSKCNHEAVDFILSDHDALRFVFDNFSRKKKVTSGLFGLKIKVREGVVVQGWAYWPFNFDPRCIISCSGFEPRDED